MSAPRDRTITYWLLVSYQKYKFSVSLLNIIQCPHLWKYDILKREEQEGNWIQVGTPKKEKDSLRG